MPSILFICTVNRFRSPLAEAVFRKELHTAAIPGNWNISSAGTWTEPGFPPMPDAVLAAAEVGLDITGHTSTPVSLDLIRNNTLIIVMHENHREALEVEFPAHKHKIYLLSAALGQDDYSIPDPYVTGEAPLVVARELIHIIRTGWRQISDLAIRLDQHSPLPE
jgi:protein-tyrosine-phosphatase